ncbi:MAG: DUF3575 domain-containing protein [Bacteroides sp.]|nr:DUF3575 domain-containing protein [Bacteroides sp.]
MTRQLGNIKIKLIIALLLLAGAASSSFAQKAALKTNLVSDALLSPNLAVEVGLAPKWTLNVAGQFNLWSVDGHKWRHWLAQPEARYWFCRRFQGHFLGLHAIGGEFNAGNVDFPVKFLGSDFHKLKDRRYEGWGVGAGIGYGYDWILSRHWNLEAELGIGWIHARFDEYPCAVCGTKLGSGHHNYFGPTKVAVNLEYVF